MYFSIVYIARTGARCCSYCQFVQYKRNVSVMSKNSSTVQIKFFHQDHFDLHMFCSNLW
jgi:hypothetical protein